MDDCFKHRQLFKALKQKVCQRKKVKVCCGGVLKLHARRVIFIFRNVPRLQWMVLVKKSAEGVLY